MSSREKYIEWYRSQYGGRDPSEEATTAWKAWQARDAEVARLVEALRESVPHVETAAEAAEERGFEHGKARQCLTRIDALLAKYEEKRDE